MPHKLTIKPGNLILQAERGENLFSFLRAHAMAPEAPCGGHGACGKCRVLVDGSVKLACRTTIDRDMEITLPARPRSLILTAGETLPVQPDTDPEQGFRIAFDIGTTTVVCYLLDALTGEELASAGALNPQHIWGADVITRIQAALEGHCSSLTGSIRKCMETLILDLCEQAEISPSAIELISVVGNPCMQQLFYGIPVDNLAKIPFLPRITSPLCSETSPFPALCPHASLLTVPDISGYVWADTVACITVTGLENCCRNTLLVDIGTNGEIVLRANGRMAACSTAAGPALEGARIRCGMRASDGAIDHVSISDGHMRCHVIGETEPQGICGSGIIDAVCSALSLGLIDRRGRILTDASTGEGKTIRLSGEIALTQDDIREIQLAKGAIAAGILILCEHLGIAPEQIDEILLAGAFGSFIDPVNARRIGLLPAGIRGPIRAVGNAAGEGAKIYALHRRIFEGTASIIQTVEPVELASEKSFRRTFAKCMYF